MVLSTPTHVDNAYNLGKRMCEKLKELIPRQQFDFAIQAAYRGEDYLKGKPSRRCARM